MATKIQKAIEMFNFNPWNYLSSFQLFLLFLQVVPLKILTLVLVVKRYRSLSQIKMKLSWMLVLRKVKLWPIKKKCVGSKTSWTAWSKFWPTVSRKKRKSRRSETFKQTTNNSCMPHVAFEQEYLFVRCPDKSWVVLLNAKCKRMVTLTGEISVNPRKTGCFVR